MPSSFYNIKFVSSKLIYNNIEFKSYKERFDIIKREGVTTIESYKSIRANYNSWVENKVNLHEASRVV